MNRYLPLLSFLFLQACIAQEENSKNDICEFSFDEMMPCTFYNNNIEITTAIKATDIAEDEKLVDQLEVHMGKTKQTLKITENTSLLAGDIGFISCADINFDNQPDLAITTSFGTPNLYLDYWVFNLATQKYEYVGNYSEFTLDTKNKTITTTVKDNAESYTTTKWYWQGTELQQK